jgi:hypothetical protein
MCKEVVVVEFACNDYGKPLKPQDVRSRDQVPKLVLPEYEARVLTTWPRLSVLTDVEYSEHEAEVS